MFRICAFDVEASQQREVLAKTHLSSEEGITAFLKEEHSEFLEFTSLFLEDEGERDRLFMSIFIEQTIRTPDLFLDCLPYIVNLRSPPNFLDLDWDLDVAFPELASDEDRSCIEEFDSLWNISRTPRFKPISEPVPPLSSCDPAWHFIFRDGAGQSKTFGEYMAIDFSGHYFSRLRSTIAEFATTESRAYRIEEMFRQFEDAKLWMEDRDPNGRVVVGSEWGGLLISSI